MKKSFVSSAKRHLHKGLRQAFSWLPRKLRHAIYRSFVEIDAKPDPGLAFKIASTRDDLEACFRLLHDAYVNEGFMKPDPSGLRATLYHALPTTTTLCATLNGEVIGTLSLIRESPMGFPLQAIFDLTEVRALGGQIAEVSSLAVHPRFRKTGGTILFPLMKVMYEYCTTYFDTRHLVIAVNPNRIDLYESLLFFTRLTEKTVDNYDFANGAPAVGAALDLVSCEKTMARYYGHKPLRKNLYHFFVKLKLASFQLPKRRYHTTNDPVMTPELLDYFFNQRTHGFAQLDEREKALLHAIYNLPAYQRVLPAVLDTPNVQKTLRQHQRYSVKCPGSFVVAANGTAKSFALQVVDLSEGGFLAQSSDALPLRTLGDATIELGNAEHSCLKASAVHSRQSDNQHFYYGFTLVKPDLTWRKFVGALTHGSTDDDMTHATRFLMEEDYLP